MKIKIVDDLDPENVAMVQGLYSRSAASVDDHLAKVQASGSTKFWDNYVVGYNHKSIADCGSTTIFIEGVSLLAAKAIQDNPLYAGQETSTRYIDMAHQPIILPVTGEKAGDGQWIMTRWMDFYVQHQGVVMLHVAKTYPRQDGEDEKVYNNAVKARTFDILRGFLPAGITTQLSWHTNLRQAGDKLTHLSHHPSSEVRAAAKRRIRPALAEKYPSSGFQEELASVSGVANKGKTPEEMMKAKAGMMDEVCKLDPQNEKNAFEQAIFLQVLKELAEVQSAKGVLAVAVPHLESLLKLADRARGIEAKLKQPSRIYRIASRAWCLLNQFENSMEWAQRALSVSKSPQESQSIKSFIEEIKAAKDKFAAATSQQAQQ